jgi:hypothetical protein
MTRWLAVADDRFRSRLVISVHGRGRPNVTKRPTNLRAGQLLSGHTKLESTKPPSKRDVVIAMLRLPEGATVDEVASVTGWQRHTVRGVLSGTLKKKLRLTLASAKEERGRVYRIAEPASP